MEDVLLNEIPEEAPEVPAASPVQEEPETLLQEEEPEVLLESSAVSGNEVFQQELLDLLYEMKGELSDVKRSNDRLLQRTQNTGISNSVPVGDVSDNSVELVSSNIITKPINEYTVSESLLLVEVIAIFAVILFLIIRKAVFKWR